MADRQWCCARDGGRPSVAALQGGGGKPPQAASVKSRGGERCGKGAPVERVRCGSRRRVKPNPCRRVEMLKVTSKPGCVRGPGMSQGDTLLTALAVSGMKRARARFRLLHGTGEPVVLESWPWRPGGGSSPSGRNREGQSTGPGNRGGPSRSSDEAPVMGVERRGRIIRGSVVRQPNLGRNG